MDEAYTVLPPLVICGLLITVGGALGPETCGADLASRPARARAPRFTRAPVGEPPAPDAARIA